MRVRGLTAVKTQADSQSVRETVWACVQSSTDNNKTSEASAWSACLSKCPTATY